MKNAPKVKRFVVKHWQTTGIVETEGVFSSCGSYFYYGGQFCGGSGLDVQVKPSYHFATRQEAVARCIVLRDKLVAALNKRIAKLQAMTFE